MKKKKMAFISLMLVCLLLLGSMAFAEGGADFFNGLFGAISTQTEETPSQVPAESNEKLPAQSTVYYVEIDVKDQGKIIVELYPEVAPITVENFLKLVDAKFYDGLTFHRIINGFMVQGGCPLGNGTGGADTNIKGEFSQNGFNNPLKHTRGVISMARSSNPNSASSQFFIMHQDAPHLDGAYAAFGKVVSGMEVVDALCQNTPVVDGNGTVHPNYTPVITSIRRVEAP